MGCRLKDKGLTAFNLFFLISYNPYLTLNIYTMDTTTVLEIIKMIDIRINNVNVDEDEDYDQYDPANIKNEGRYHALTDFRDHLQSFIEGQLNAAENQTGE
jgi:hypothetical protein